MSTLNINDLYDSINNKNFKRLKNLMIFYYKSIEELNIMQN